MVAALVHFPHLSEAASLTADRDQSHMRGSSPLLQHLATRSWQPPCESNDFCQTFQEMQKLRLEKEGSLLSSLLVVRIFLRISQNLAFPEVLLKTRFSSQ